MTRSDIATYLERQIETGHRDHAIRQAAAWLVEHRRTGEATYLAQDVARIAETHGYITATITTALPLGAKLKAKVMSLLKNRGAQTIELKEELDTSLIGGAIVATPTSELDLSLTGSLHQLLRGDIS